MSDGGVTGRDREEFDNNSWLHIGTLLSPLSSADQSRDPSQLPAVPPSPCTYDNMVYVVTESNVNLWQVLEICLI